MKLKKEQDYNLLDSIPVIHSEITWKRAENGQVTISVPLTGFYHKIAQYFFHRPKQTHISLEKYGNIIWEHIDGVRSIYEIGKIVKEYFGEEAEPLYPRLCQYFRMLESCNIITLKNNIL